MKAIGRLIQARPWTTTALAAVLVVLGASASTFAGFEIADRKLPTYGLWKAIDQTIASAIPDREPTRPPQLQAATIESMLIKFKTEVRTVDIQPPGYIDLMAYAGGGMASFGDDLLLLAYDGKIHANRPGQNVRMTAITAPDTNRDAFRALADDPAYKNYGIYSSYVRYNDLNYFEDGAKRGFLASYTEYNPEGFCFVNAVARLDIDPSVKSIDEVKAGPRDWTVIYRSKPCIAPKTRHNAIEAHMAGGRMAILNPHTVILTMGDFHLDGMVSDGLGIAQDPTAEYGKIMQIDIQTGASKILSTGHRNAQGVMVDEKGDIYIAEHGPQGGDELNKIIEGRNYGWPKESYGITYTSDKLPEATSFGRHETYEPPIFAWMPSVAVSGIIKVNAGFHDNWTGDMLVGSLSSMSLYRIRFAGDRPVYSEKIAIGSRIRAIHQHTNGQIVLWTDNRELIWLTAEDLVSSLGVLKSYIRDNELEPSLARKLETAVTRCAECHSFAVGDNARSPSLGRIYSDPIAASNFPSYSPGLKAKSGDWTKENLTSFLTNPQQFAPGTTMPYAIEGDPALVAAVVEYLGFYDRRF